MVRNNSNKGDMHTRNPYNSPDNPRCFVPFNGINQGPLNLIHKYLGNHNNPIR